MTLLAATLLAATFTRTMERVSTMDPAMAQSLYDAHAVCLVYEAPLAVDYLARPYRLVPGACELPRVSADGLTYDFVVRAGGRSLTAADVVRSLERLRDPAVVSPNGWILKDVTTMTAIDERTVRIRLRRRVRYFPWLMAMPAAAVRCPDGSGTGAYDLVSWRKNHEMVFRKRVKRCGDGPEEIRYLVVDDLSTQWLMFLRGEIDFLGEVSRDNWDSIVNAEGRIDPSLEVRGIRLHTMPTLDTMYLGINMRDPVLGPNRKLRQALNAAFDYPAWEKFYNHRIVEAGGPLPDGVAGHLPAETFPYRFDLAKAKRLMREAGYPDGLDPNTGRRLVLSLAIGRASQESREAGELTAAFYARIGIRLELKYFTWDAFLKAVNEGRVQMYRMGWVGDYPDAQNFLQLFHSANVNPGVNHSSYANPEFDAAYEREDWKRCQEIVREDCPWVFTHFNVANSLTGPRVSGYVPSAFSHGNERYYRIREGR